MSASAHDRGYRQAVRRLHALGPRPTGELLAEIAARCPDAAPVLRARLARYAEIDPDVVRWLGADDWLDEQDLIRVVAGGRS